MKCQLSKSQVQQQILKGPKHPPVKTVLDREDLNGKRLTQCNESCSKEAGPWEDCRWTMLQHKVNITDYIECGQLTRRLPICVSLEENNIIKFNKKNTPSVRKR